MMIYEPRDGLLAFVDGIEGLRADIVKELRLTIEHRTPPGTDMEDLIIWAPDWFYSAYRTLASHAEAANGNHNWRPLFLGVTIRSNSDHPEWGDGTDDRSRRFHIRRIDGQVKEAAA